MGPKTRKMAAPKTGTFYRPNIKERKEIWLAGEVGGGEKKVKSYLNPKSADEGAT